MKAAAIKYALAVREYTQADVARECDVSRNSVHMVIHGNGRSQKIENRIAAITRVPLADLWPDWHGPQAKHRRRSGSLGRTAEALRAVLG